MNDLYCLIHDLRKSELQAVRSSLVCYSSRKQVETKSLQLFEYLLKQEIDPPSRDCCMAIYGSPDDTRFKMLRSRLRNKILETLLLDINIRRKDNLDETEQASMIVTKKWLQCNYLYRTIGNTQVTYELMSEIIKLSKEYELYSSLVQCLQFKKYHRLFVRGLKEFVRLNKEIEQYEYCYKSVYKAGDYYYSLITRNDFYTKGNKNNYQEMIKDAVIDLNKDYKITKSARVLFYIKQLEIEYFLNGDEYLSAKDVCLELLHLVQTNKSVLQKQRIGIAYDDLANCEILLDEYSEAVEHVKMAQKYFPAESFNYNASMEVEFYAYFYGKDYSEAGILIAKLLKSLPSQENDFRIAKYGFLQANVYFKKANYRLALKSSQALDELTQDKIGWNISLRVLSIMSLLEMDKCDEAAIHIENLRKHMKRHSRKSELKERDFDVLSFLMLAEKKGFVKDTLSETQLQILKRLCSNEKKYKWEKFSPEIIPFHEWAISHFDTRCVFVDRILTKNPGKNKDKERELMPVEVKRKDTQ